MNETLRQRLQRPGILVAPGVYDALTATMATEAGFEALYLSGAAFAYTRLGRPDLGLVSVTEVAETVALVRDRVATPLIVDGDTGFGNALNVERTVRLFARAGANAIQLEDQTFPKRCGHLRDKSLVSTGEMVGKLKAALDVRPDEDFLVIARTDAVAVEGLDAALARAHAYAEAGVDILFVEAPRSGDQLAAIPARMRTNLPLMANMVEGGQTPIRDAAALEGIGYRLVIFPGGIVRALAHAMRAYYASLRATGSNDAFRDRMFDFDGINGIVGTEAMLARAARYDSGGSGE